MTQLIATLDMYDWPEVQAETDAFWGSVRRGLAAAGLDAPACLDRSQPSSEFWAREALLLGQTCGFPLILGRCGEAHVVARGSYDVEGCGRGTYRSAILVRREDVAVGLANFKGRRVAINDWDSQSGVNTLKDALVGLADPELPFFSEVVVSGAHRASGLAVANGAADLAALDAVAWHLFQRLEPEAAEKLSILQWTAEVPSLPFITSIKHQRYLDDIWMALSVAAADLSTAQSSGALPVEMLRATRENYLPIAKMYQRTSEIHLAPPAISQNFVQS